MMLSKSDYMMFLKQPAWLWLKKNDPKKLPPVDENTQALFDAGHQFEPFAESLFPEGATLGFSDYSEYLSLPERTQDAIKNGTQVLFQPRFEWQDFTCICDIVSFVGENEVDLYEIKASTSAKVEHEFDLAFQTAVLEGTGLKIRNVFVIHVNNQYVRNGAIEADKITYTEDVTTKVRKRSDATAKYMPLALTTAQQKTMPDPSPALAKLGSKKSWMQVYEAIVPQTLKEYPADIAPTIQHDEVKKFLGGLKYPLYFLDYETLMSLVPYFDGHRPYQQVPFQYSLHVLQSPDAELDWKEYLHRENSNPARPLTEQLINDIADSGTVLVWYEGFEKARNTELGEMLPEYKEAMEAINNRVVDLMLPFKNKWYDDPRFEGSASIKQVLPVMCPELSYKDLGIQEGGSAQRLWMEAVLDDKRADQKEQILADLIEYCKLDTLAMVEIYRKLVAL
ncbi:MAG TPA: DUF2779 domain-containing protein [Candidatus Saccharibacteria bacterium]|nr:DUF2779 domain-containing protein [Candidatus Saccharibacteria bacterium]